MKRKPILGSYQVISKIQSGVFRGVNLKSGEFVVLKRDNPAHFSEASNAEEAARQALEYEHRNNTICHDHPNIVTVQDFFTWGKRMYLVTEDAGKETLLDLAKRKDENGVLSSLDQLARALEFMHDCFVVHRDVKPENVAIRQNGSAIATLVDFGCSDHLHTAKRAFVSSSGTERYMSPEQALDSPPETSQDVFGYCATAFTCLTRKFPYGFKNGETDYGSPRFGPDTLKRYGPLGGLIVEGLNLLADERPSMSELAKASQTYANA